MACDVFPLFIYFFLLPLNTLLPFCQQLFAAHKSPPHSMSVSQQQQERQTYIASTGERRPLLARTIERTVSWTTARLEADQVDTDTQEAIAKKEEEEETQWFAELRRRPWLQRPSVYWLIPWSALCGVITGLCTTTMWQLRSRTMCHHLLRNPTIHTYPGSFGLLSEGVSQWAPLDECMTPTMIGMVRQLESRIVTISSVSRKCQVDPAK